MLVSGFTNTGYIDMASHFKNNLKYVHESLTKRFGAKKITKK